MTPAERQMLTEVHRAVTAQGDKGGMLVPTWQRVAALLAESRADRGRKVNVDVAELADLLRDGLGDEIAGRVADELGKRLGR